MADRTDDHLVIDFAAGDENALRILVQRWERQVFAFLMRMLGSAEEAEDLCQETFMRLINAAPRYRPSGQFPSWLFRIAGNLARSRLRRRKILRWLPLTPEHHATEAPGHDPLDALVEEQEQHRVQAAIGRLPDRQREALVLKQYHDLSYKEIAEAMGTSVTSVQMLLHRAMATLRKEITRQGDRP
jgi:RNA polymerase sigma-70 factor (ECF subfamily)